MNIKDFFRPTKFKILLTIFLSLVVEYIFYYLYLESYCSPCPYDTGVLCAPCPPINYNFLKNLLPYILIISYVFSCSLQFVINKLKINKIQSI